MVLGDRLTHCEQTGARLCRLLTWVQTVLMACLEYVVLVHCRCRILQLGWLHKFKFKDCLVSILLRFLHNTGNSKVSKAQNKTNLVFYDSVLFTFLWNWRTVSYHSFILWWVASYTVIFTSPVTVIQIRNTQLIVLPGRTEVFARKNSPSHWYILLCNLRLSHQNVCLACLSPVTWPVSTSSLCYVMYIFLLCLMVLINIFDLIWLCTRNSRKAYLNW